MSEPFKKVFITSSSHVLPSPVEDIMREIVDDIRKQEEDNFRKELLGVMPYRFKLSELSCDDYIDSLRYFGQPVLNPRAVIKLNTKETNEMEAKKCDKCGKLYDKIAPRARVRFKFKEVYGADELKEEVVANRQLEEVQIKNYGTEVDLCPDCIDSFKKWWESAEK